MTKKLLLLITTATVLSAHTLAADVQTWDVVETQVSSKMIAIDPAMPYNPYEINQQRYIYDWELPTDISWFNVYKWVTDMAENDKLKNVISALKINQFDISALENTTLTNITLKENKENWFRVSIDFENWYLSVYRDYSYTYYKNLSEQNIPVQRLSDEEALKIAKDFIEKYKLNVSAFGEPYVENNQMIMYAKSSMDSSSYVDPYIQIVFPTKLDGKNVNERYGQNAWLRISVASQTKSIEWFSVKLEKLEKTDEAKIITDQARLKKIIGKWGYEYDYQYGPEYTVKYQDIKLNNARIEYVKVETYINWINTYYAPALVFDVERPSDPMIYVQDKIIVPLVDKAYENY